MFPELTNSSFLEPLEESYFNNASLTSFDISLRNVKAIPCKSNLLKNIRRAQIMHCRLVEIPNGLEKYENIQTIDFTDNQLTKFPKNFFDHFTGLTSLNLTANNVKRISCDLPKSLVNIDLSYNYGLDVETIWDKILPNLKTVKLGYCGIEVLPEDLPLWAETITTLILDGNKLTEFPRKIEDYEYLEEIGLFGNRIKEMPKIEYEQNFKSINLSYNLFEKFEIIKGLKIHSINLSGNLLTEFPMDILEIEEIHSFFLSKNEIEGTLDFSIPESVKIIDLSHNKISNLSKNFLQSTKNLTMLNLSFNNISEIDDCFENKMKIMKLYLNNNNLTSLPSNLFENLPKL